MPSKPTKTEIRPAKIKNIISSKSRHIKMRVATECVVCQTIVNQETMETSHWKSKQHTELNKSNDLIQRGLHAIKENIIIHDTNKYSIDKRYNRLDIHGNIMNKSYQFDLKGNKMQQTKLFNNSLIQSKQQSNSTSNNGNNDINNKNIDATTDNIVIYSQ